MKTEKFYIRVAPAFKARAKAYAKRHNSDVSKITVSLWESILRGEKIRKKS